MGVLDRFLKLGEGRKLKALADLVPDINALAAEYEALSDSDLRAKTPEFRQRLDNGEELDNLLIEAFAVTREAASRVIGQRHYDVQMMGGAALHFGWVAEMRTGEGKTLVSTLPVYLNGLTGNGVHVITVNDYLATRDSEWMGRVHKFLGLTIGLVVPNQWNFEDKRQQYACDITYGTNNEFGFDYLRDNMAMSRPQQVQRGHNYAIVDEVDSILIDEARTPLIISGQVADAAKLYYRFASIVRGLARDVDYEVDEEKRTVSPLESGIEKVEKALGVENIYDDPTGSWVHQLTVALKAKDLYLRDRDYLVADGQVKIVDEFTGRVLEGRRWSEGLHQAVEAKEGVRIKEENQTLATITLQNYFRLYEKLAGMTGTAQTEAAELMNTYGLQVVTIPTHKSIQRFDATDLVYKNEGGKFDAVVEDIVSRQESGQPVLVGTVSVEKSERLSRLLEQRGVPHEVLNAKQHTREAEVVAQAGRVGAVTVATNMAGRGVDILLGGNPEGLAARECAAEGLEEGTEEYDNHYEKVFPGLKAECESGAEQVLELGGLYVLGTERHESRRIDNQLRGRSGRQGDPGASRFYLSLEDDLMRLLASSAMQVVMGKNWPDDEPIEAKMVTKAIERAQNTVEQRNAEIRKNVLKYDEVMNEQRKVIYGLRDQVLDGVDLTERVRDCLVEAVSSTIDTFCDDDHSEDWDIEHLHAEMSTYWPVSISQEELASVASTDEMYEKLVADGLHYFDVRIEELGDSVMTELQHHSMLTVIDARWRDHLRAMDHLQDGIGLRAMGQKDPLTEWQREGFEMFEQLLTTINGEFLKYVMHARLVVEETPPPAAEAMDYSAPDENAGTAGAGAPVGKAPAAVGTATKADASSALPASGATATAPEDAAQQPVVKSEWDKTPRNAPCPCGSGKKFKVCHGRD